MMVTGTIVLFSISHVTKIIKNNFKYFCFSPFTKNFIKTNGIVKKSAFIHENDFINFEYTYKVKSKEYSSNIYSLVPLQKNEINFPEEASEEFISFHDVKKYSSLMDTLNQLKKNNSIEVFYHKKFPKISYIKNNFSLQEYLKEIILLIAKLIITIHLITLIFK